MHVHVDARFRRKGLRITPCTLRRLLLLLTCISARLRDRPGGVSENRILQGLGFMSVFCLTAKAARVGMLWLNCLLVLPTLLYVAARP